MRPIAIALTFIACASGRPDKPPDAASSSDGNAGSAACEAPDVLVLLDRTMSMSKRPDGSTPSNTLAGHSEAKWSIAIAAIEALTSKFDASIRFGLALFPRDPGGGKCITLQQRLSGKSASNSQCDVGELLVPPAPTTATTIAATLDPEATVLCTSTPIGKGLATAQNALAAIATPVRPQYVLFVGDGRDTCNGGLVLANAHALAAADVKLYVLAFDGSADGIDNALLNDLACAGRTATGFPSSCIDEGAGRFVAANRNGPALYFRAENGLTLATALGDIAGQVCCGCTL
jgi:hypothetical protein